MTRLLPLFILALSTLIIISCEQRLPTNEESEPPIEKKLNDDTTYTVGNITTTISSDVNVLDNLLDFSKYKPIRVKFKYTFIDNSGKGERITVPGPSDYSLEAVMYFDSLTFRKILDFEKNLESIPVDYNMEGFMFDWLDIEVKAELKNSNKKYHGHPDYFFSGANGKSWYLDKKILLQKAST